MKPWLMDYLCCPACRERLACAPRSVEGNEAVTGTLHCANCGRCYPIEGGVPRLLTDTNSVHDSFTYQWERQLAGSFETNGNCFGLDPARVVSTLARRVPEPKPGSVIVDAGCGLGEKAAVLADRFPDCHVVAFDLTPTVCTLHKRYAGRPNLHFVQADLNRNPFVESLADMVMSIGVIHHTADPERSFNDLARLLKPNRSDLLLWVYLDPSDDPARRRYYWRRDVAFLGRGHRLPHPVSYAWCYAYTWALALPGYYLRRGLRRLMGAKSAPDGYALMGLREKARSMAFVLFDNVTARFQHRLPADRVRLWFHANGLEIDSTGEGDFGLFVGQRNVSTKTATSASSDPASSDRRVAEPKMHSMYGVNEVVEKLPRDGERQSDRLQHHVDRAVEALHD